MKISTRIKIGVIGCGKQAQETHIPNLTSIPEAQLVALSDTNVETLERVGKSYNVTKLFPSHLDLLGADVDAVLICTPTSTHATIAQQAAKAGKHFFIEKPIATNVVDAEQVIKEVEANQVKAMVGFQMRFLPNHLKVKELIEKGYIGELSAIEIHSETLQIKPEDGILLDYGVHFFDLVRWYLDGEPVEKVEGALKVTPNAQSAVVTIQFKNGIVGSVNLYWVPSYNSWERVERYARFIGVKGKISTDQSSPVIRLYRPGGVLNRLRGYQSIMLPFAIHPSLPISATTYRKEIEEFVHSIREDRSPSVSAFDGLMALKIAEAASHIEREKRHLMIEQ